ncbi:MAG: hypothetical protein LBC20_13930 [Planctomycetaceae bacterium]|nr:hypothetical protein [Planctomycetaceae bacterium]
MNLFTVGREPKPVGKQKKNSPQMTQINADDFSATICEICGLIYKICGLICVNLRTNLQNLRTKAYGLKEGSVILVLFSGAAVRYF